MRFSKTVDISKVIPITTSKDNILGVSFVKKNIDTIDIEIIEWNFSKTDQGKIQTSKEEVLKQVLSGLESVNKSLGTNSRLSKFLENLTGAGLINKIEFDGKNTFVITSKGRQYLDSYVKFSSIAESFGLEL